MTDQSAEAPPVDLVRIEKLLVGTDRFAAILREKVAAFHEPFSNSEVGALAAFFSVRGMLVSDLALECGRQWEMPTVPTMMLTSGVMVDPNDHLEFAEAWDGIAANVDAEIGAARDYFEQAGGPGS